MKIKYSENTLSYLVRKRRLDRENWTDMKLTILRSLLLKKITIADIAHALNRSKGSVLNAALHLIDLEKEKGLNKIRDLNGVLFPMRLSPH